MIKKSKQLQTEIRIAVAKMLEEEQKKITLPKPFDGFVVQSEADKEFPSEPLEFKGFGQNKEGHFFLIVTKL